MNRSKEEMGLLMGQSIKKKDRIICVGRIHRKQQRVGKVEII